MREIRVMGDYGMTASGGRADIAQEVADVRE